MSGRRRSSSWTTRAFTPSAAQAASKSSPTETVLPGAELDHLTLNAFNLRGLDEALHRVRHEGQVALGVQAAELHLLFPREELDQDGRKNGAGGLARAVGVERPQRHHGHFEGAVVGLAELVRRDLRGAVGRLTLEGMGFADGDAVRRPVDLAGRCVHHPAAARTPGALQHVERALHVGVHEALRGCIAVRDGDERRQMKDGVHTSARLLHEAGVADVTQPHIQALLDRRFGVVQPAQRSVRVVEAEGAYVGAQRDEALGQMAPDEAVGTRHQDLASRPAHGLSPSPRARRNSLGWPTSIQSSLMGNAPTASPRSRHSSTRVGRGKYVSFGTLSTKSGSKT